MILAGTPYHQLVSLLYYLIKVAYENFELKREECLIGKYINHKLVINLLVEHLRYSWGQFELVLRIHCVPLDSQIWQKSFEYFKWISHSFLGEWRYEIRGSQFVINMLSEVS